MSNTLIPRSQASATNAATVLLAEREGRALRWTAIARIAGLTLAIVVAVPVMDSVDEVIATLVLCAIVLCAQVAILRSVRNRPGGVSIGLLGVITDALFLCALPVIWHLVYTTEDRPLVHLSRHNLTAVCLTVIALNGLTLRPLYPALLTALGVVLHATLAWLALSDPRLDQFDGGLQRAIGVGFSDLDLMFVAPFFVGLAGVFVTLAARAARATVREAVAREHSEHQLREQQLQVVMRTKMEAVGDLVAGVQHEVNSPLGALHSAADTAEKALGRLRSALTAEDAGTGNPEQRALAAAEGSLALIVQASQRLSKVMATIRNFAQLDRAVQQLMDLGEILRTALDIQRPSLRADTEVVVDVADGVMVEGDPRRIAEALSTVLRNAAESLDGPGALTVRLRSEDGRACIEIQDSGRGMSPELVEQLFEIDFAQRERTQTRFGLPLCHSILVEHGGDIEVASELGRGTTVTMQLPLMSLS